MNRSAYKYNINASLIIDDQSIEFNPNYIKYILIDSEYEEKYMPVIYISLSVTNSIYKKLVANEKNGKIFLNITRYNQYSQNKLYRTYIKDQFSYVVSGNNPSYTEDLSSSSNSDNTYSVITIALINMTIMNKIRTPMNGVFSKIDQYTLIMKALEGLNCVVCPPKYNPFYDTIMIPPLTSKQKILYYLCELNPFYDTNYMFFVDFDRAYLLDFSGDYCNANDGQKPTVLFDIDTVTSASSYFEGMEERESDYYINVNPANTNIGLNKKTDKIANQLIFIDDDGAIEKVDIDVNSAADDSVVKQIFTRGEHAKLYMNIMNSSSTEIELAKEGLDGRVISPNKQYLIRNAKDPSVNGKYTLMYKKEVIKNNSGTFNESLAIGLRKIGDIVPLTKDVSAKDSYSDDVSRRNILPVRPESEGDDNPDYDPVDIYDVVSTAADGLAPKSPGGTTRFLRADGTWAVPTGGGGGGSYDVVTTDADGLAPMLPSAGSTAKFLRADATWQTPPNDNTTYGAATTNSSGLMPPIGNDSSKYLRNDATWQVPPNDNTTYGAMTSGTSGLVPSGGTNAKYLRGDASWEIPTDTTYGVVSTLSNGLMTSTDKIKLDSLPNTGSDTSKYLRNDGSWQVPPNDNTTYGTMTSGTSGLVPSGGTSAKYLRGDATWETPPNDNTTYGAATTASSGLMPPIGTDTSKYLRNDGSWQTPPNTTYGAPTTDSSGLVPPLTNISSRFLRADGTWAVPAGGGGGGSYDVVTTDADGLAPMLPSAGSTEKFLRADATWQVPPGNVWEGTKAEYDNLPIIDPNTTYYIR